MTSFHHYLPIDKELFHDGFYVTGAGRTRSAPGTPYPVKPHPTFYQFTWTEGRILPEFAIILITQGKGTFESKETGLRRIERGQVILLFPGIWHRYRPDPTTGWTEKWIQFNGEFAHKLWDRDVLTSKRPVLSPHNFRQIETAMETVLARIEKRPGFNSLRYALQVAHVLDLIVDFPEEPPAVPAHGILPIGDELVVAAQNYIWTHSQLDISVQDIATFLGTGRRTLERKFAATLGRTVLEEITSCRFNRAERLLRETDLPLKAIVHLAGFGRAENMRQAFTKQIRLNPRAYRAHVRIDR